VVSIIPRYIPRKGEIVVRKIGCKSAVVTLKELGSNCWLPKRFIKGARCDRVMECTYPEKKTCEAVDAEIAYIRQGRAEAEVHFHAKINKLLADKRR